MTVLTSFFKTDLVDDHVAADVNDLIAASLRSEYKNVETLSATRTLEDVDTPIQRYECGAADRIVKMPTADSVDNHPYIIINASAAARTLTIQTNDGGTTLKVIDNTQAALLIPDGDGGYRCAVFYGSQPAETGGSACFTRCSLASGNPNPTTDQSAKTALYVMPYNGGNTFPLWNGTKFDATVFAELTATLSSSYQLAGSVYDVYLFNDAGTLRAGFGVAWSSTTSRGTGAGTAEIETVYGVDVNKNSMTVRNSSSSYTVAARYGTLVGTIAPSTNGQLNWTDSLVEVCNRYNLREKKLLAKTTGYYNYTTATWRQAGNITTIALSRVAFVQCITNLVNAKNSAMVYNASNAYMACGIGLDRTNANDADTFGGATVAGVQPVIFSSLSQYLLGYHYLQRVEISEAAGTTTWLDNPTNTQCGMVGWIQC